MTDVILETTRALVLLVLVIFLWRFGMNRFEASRKGWNLVFSGFLLLLFASVLDITDNFEELNRFVVIGDTEVEAFLEKFVGFLGGFVLLTIGLIMWIPTVQRLTDEIGDRERAELELERAKETLEDNVRERTAQLSDANEELQREIVERERVQEELERRYHEAELNKEVLEEQATNLATLAEQYDDTRRELEILNQEKNKFFSIIAHDLKSPFTALLGFAELLVMKGDQLPPDMVKQYATAIDRSGRKVFDLLENLLDWARIQMDKIAFEPGPHDLQFLIHKTTELMSGVVAGKGVTFTANVPPLTVFADADMVDTIVRNLVQNAIKFTPEGGEVTVAAENHGENIAITVSDTGVGMPPDRVVNLFSLDKQISTTGTGGEPGTGLGLLLCKDLVEKNGGTLEVESEIGKGSAFRFFLPSPSHALHST